MLQWSEAASSRLHPVFETFICQSCPLLSRPCSPTAANYYQAKQCSKQIAKFKRQAERKDSKQVDVKKSANTKKRKLETNNLEVSGALLGRLFRHTCTTLPIHRHTRSPQFSPNSLTFQDRLAVKTRLEFVVAKQVPVDFKYRGEGGGGGLCLLSLLFVFIFCRWISSGAYHAAYSGGDLFVIVNHHITPHALQIKDLVARDFENITKKQMLLKLPSKFNVTICGAVDGSASALAQAAVVLSIYLARGLRCLSVM